MRNGYKITLGIITILILITITIGTSYSFYSVSDTQTDPNSLTTTCFQIDYNGSDNINLTGDGNYAYPMNEETALAKTPYTFTIKNTCTSTNANGVIKYDVSLNTLTDEISNLSSALRFKLNKTAPVVAEGSSDMLSKLQDKLDANIKIKYGIDNSYHLISGTLAPDESVTYNLYLWIDESANNSVMGQTFNGKVLVYAYM